MDDQLLEALFEYCDVNDDGQIDHVEFSNFLNWKDKMQVGADSILRKKEGTETKEPNETTSADHESPKQLRKQVDQAVVDYKKSSQMIGAIVGGIKTKGEKVNNNTYIIY